jgi:hypothetical protein
MPSIDRMLELTAKHRWLSRLTAGCVFQWVKAFCLFHELLHANPNGVPQLGQDHLKPNPLKVSIHQAPKHRLYIIGYSDSVLKEITKNQTFHVLSNKHSVTTLIS